MKEIKEIGFIDKGTGKHQSNIVYDVGGGIANPNRIIRSKNKSHDFRYALCNGISYCIDANYAKGISFEEYIKKHRRQLVIEQYE